MTNLAIGLLLLGAALRTRLGRLQAAVWCYRAGNALTGLGERFLASAKREAGQ